MTLLSKSLTNKLIHPPTVALRSASADGKTDLIDQLREVYQLQSILLQIQRKV